MSKTNIGDVGGGTQKNNRWLGLVFQYLLLVIICITFFTAALSFIAPTASAAPADDYCKKYNPSGSGSAAQTTACVKGFNDTSGTVVAACSYPTQAEKDACNDGFRAGDGGQANPADNANPATAVDEPNVDDTGTTCAIENIGWILCPVIKATATMSDKLFQFLADHFLEIEPELLTANPGGNGKGTITAWEQARNLANIAFVIAFIVIIYSQITGAGLNNYGIKRMLPRLIVAAIAVNVSYYICQAIVDLSNLLGYAIMNALQSISNDIGPAVMGGSNQGTNTETGDGWLAKIAVGAIAVAGLVWLMVGPLLSVIGVVIITCIVVVIILLLRKAFIVLLVVISPLAFVAYLLPNTEKYFSKWLNMFWQLLMVFPVIALLLGGGQLASTIILVAGSQEPAAASQQVACGNEAVNDNTSADNNPAAADNANRVQKDAYGVQGECSEEVTMPDGSKRQAGWTLGLVAAGVAVAPLLAVWAVLKGAIGAAGAIGGKLSGAVQKSAAGGTKGVGGFVKKKYDGSAFGVGREIRQSGKKNFKRQRVLRSLGARGTEDNPLSLTDRYRQAAAGGVPGLMSKSSRLNVGSINAQNQAITRAASAREQIDSEDVKSELSAIEYAAEGKLAGAQNAFDSALQSGDQAKAKASVAALMTTGEKGIDALAMKLEAAQTRANSTGNHDLANMLKEYMMQAHGNVKDKNAAIHAWTTSTQAKSGETGAATVNDYANSSSTYSKLSDAQFATQTGSSLSTAGARAALGKETENAEGLKETRGHRLLSNPESAKNFSDDKRTIIASNGGNIAPH